jgi:hypothetical protein
MEEKNRAEDLGWWGWRARGWKASATVDASAVQVRNENSRKAEAGAWFRALFMVGGGG